MPRKNEKVKEEIIFVSCQTFDEMLRCGPSLKRPSIYRQIKFTHGYIWFPMLPLTSVHNPKNMNGSEKDLDRFPQITLTIWFEKIMKCYFLAFSLCASKVLQKKHILPRFPPYLDFH